jgi:phosphoglycerate dehydrogenase-like enzyme
MFMIVSLVNWKNNYIPRIENLLGEKIYECHDKQDAINNLPEAEIVITFGGGDGDYAIPIDKEILKVCKNLQLVLSLSAGIEKLPLRELYDKGIKVCNTKGAHGGSIAEYVLGGMLVLSHHYHVFIRNQEKCLWSPILHGEDIEEKTLCVIGAGSIGQVIGKKAKALNMRVIGIKKHPQTIEGFDQVVNMEHLHDVLEQSDYVVLATPLNKETYHLIGEEEFLKMRKNAVFINISRGNTVDENALIQALNKQQIAGAVLDVFQIEPLPIDNPLWKMENVLITPHGAGPTDNTERKTIRIIYDNIINYKEGLELINQITEY